MPPKMNGTAPIAWDQYESVLLLDAYFRWQSGEPFKQVITQLSIDLRQKAINAGYTIDERYRNVNGMELQIKAMQSVVTNGKFGLHRDSRHMKNAYQLYMSKPAQYLQLLKEARQLVNPQEPEYQSSPVGSSVLHASSQPVYDVQPEETNDDEAFEFTDIIQQHRTEFYMWMGEKPQLKGRETWVFRLIFDMDDLLKARHFSRLTIFEMTSLKELRDAKLKLVMSGTVKSLDLKFHGRLHIEVLSHYINFFKHTYGDSHNPVYTKHDPEPQALRALEENDGPMHADVRKDSQPQTQPSLEHFRDFAHSHAKKSADIPSLIDALKDIDAFISSSVDHDGSIIAATSETEARSIFLSLLSDDAFHQLNRKHEGRCVSAVQLYMKMLKEENDAASEPSKSAPITSNPSQSMRPVQIEQAKTAPVSEPNVQQAEKETATQQMTADEIPDDPALAYAKGKGIRWVDKRQQNGCLWLIGDMRLYRQINELRQMGYDFKYAIEGGKATNGEPGWYLQSKYYHSSTIAFEQQTNMQKIPEIEEVINDCVAEDDTPLSVTDPLFGFDSWMHNETALSESSMQRYRWAMHVIDEYVKQNNLDLPLLYADAEQAKMTAEALLMREDFAEKNSKQHNRLSAALGQYLRYLGGDGTIDRKDSIDHKEQHQVAIAEDDVLLPFAEWMEQEAHLSKVSVTRYRWAIGVIERFIKDRHLPLELIGADSRTVIDTTSRLLAMPEFAEKNAKQHNRFSAALRQYAQFTKVVKVQNTPVPYKTDSPVQNPLKASSAMRSIEEQQNAFRSWMQANGMANGTSIVYCNALNQCGQIALEKGVSPIVFYQMTSSEAVLSCKERLMADADFAERNTRRGNQFSAAMTKYYLFMQETDSGEARQPYVAVQAKKTIDPRWKEILEKDFPDGYILNDFLAQFQAAGMWQEHFGEPCPLEGEAIDQAIAACGTVKDGHVFIDNEDEGKLLAEIADLIADTHKTYSNIYSSQVYQRYREALIPLSIFTEKVMVQQVMQYAAGRFSFTYSYLFTKPGDTAVTEIDCERALRKHGGMMTTDEAADELWFIPRDKVGHYLSANSEILNLGTGQWMLAEHFPFSREDAEQVAQLLDERFLSQEYILSRDIPDLLQQNLPFIAENVASLSFAGLFNIIFYYLKDRYGFTRSIVTPAGVKVDFSMLYSAYAREHESFSLDDLDSYSRELHVPIYWESTFAGGGVRISQNEFVNRSQIHFDVYAIDRALESICSGDYISFQSIPVGMLVLLPSCGYQWNRYLLQSYVYGFSKVFRMQYSSFTKGGCFGAIVRRDCKTIDSYEKLIEQVLTDDSTWVTQVDALDLIVRQGYQAVRKLNGLENIIARAKQNKLNDAR